jgi:predicted nucleotidyltransferase
MLSATIIKQLLQQNKTYLQERFGIESLVLFGSFARNNQQENSDVDILYRIIPGKTMSLIRLQRLEQYISQLIQNRKIELVSGNHVEPIIQSTIEKEGIVVF